MNNKAKIHLNHGYLNYGLYIAWYNYLSWTLIMIKWDISF